MIKKIILFAASLTALSSQADEHEFCKKISQKMFKSFPNGEISTDILFDYTVMGTKSFIRHVKFKLEYERHGEDYLLKDCKQISTRKAKISLERIVPAIKINQSNGENDLAPKFEIQFKRHKSKWKIYDVKSDNAEELIYLDLKNSFEKFSQTENVVFPKNFAEKLRLQINYQEYPAHLKSLKEIFNPLLEER